MEPQNWIIYIYIYIKCVDVFPFPIKVFSVKPLGFWRCNSSTAMSVQADQPSLMVITVQVSGGHHSKEYATRFQPVYIYSYLHIQTYINYM